MILGIFLISLTTLAFEVALTRLLSVISWYHLAFFAISTAMLGMTAGATTVYLKPNWFTQEKLNINISKTCLAYSLTIPISLILLCMSPFVLHASIMSIFVVGGVTLACMLPFYFSGIVVTGALTKYKFSIGKLYASSLIGSSCGCLFVLGGLEIIDAPSLILLCGAISILAAFSFAWSNPLFKLRRISRWYLVSLIFIAVINSFTPYGIRPFVAKGRVGGMSNYLLEKWNSLSRIVVYKEIEGQPSYWGKSPLAPEDKKVFYYGMNIDGEAATTLTKFASIDDISYLRFDVTNIAYYLRPKGGACIIGVGGGGRDVQSAILFGHEKITGIDINPIFINLLKTRFKEFAGIASRKEVNLVTNEARSFLSSTKEKYSVIQMSLVDTWAATAAGAFSLSENALYTTQAWKIFLNRLKDDGIFTVSRWYSPKNLGETGRIISLAVATLLDSGEITPYKHIAMVTTNELSTLLISKHAFSEQDIERLKNISSDLQFELVISPDRPPENEILRSIILANSWKQLHNAIKDRQLNYTPTTDENPYFFNMLRLAKIGNCFDSNMGLIRGNLIATLTLSALILTLLFLVIATIVVPLWLRSRFNGHEAKIFWPAAMYFSLIGAGFMFTEIALVQKLSVFLGHPIYALGIILFTIIASAGIGSFFSAQLPLTRKPWVFIYPFIIACSIAAIRFILPSVESQMVSSAMLTKIFISIIILVPLGFLLGIAFPTGMRLVSSEVSETPWYWALNGIFSVLCSALAVFVSIYLGISINFYIASGCYILLLCFLPYMYRESRKFQAQICVK
ncbi:MAG: hypothetical protein Q8O30_05590 [Candidatus Omnitrophota bacterium]|nr:hypothetical protein [Candidatus Omnitrophota bacterium]